jgi:2-hydroxy fatty acid dioxygenase
MEPVAGLMAMPIILGSTAYSNRLLTLYGATANQWAIAVNIVSWIAQFIGHGVFEGRAPALVDNIVQALFLAPFFVWFEILFNFGYRPELKSRLDKAVEVEVKKFQQSKSTKAQENGSSTKTE